MAINIKNLQERIQKKVFSVSPSTPTADLGDIVEAATLATGSLRQYDSAGLLPSVTSTQAQIAYTKKDNAIKHKSANATTWKTLTTDAYAAGARPTPPTYSVQGSTYGWSMGGYPGPANYHNQIQRYAFANSNDAVDQGDLLAASMHAAAVGRTATAGLRIGGRSYPGTTYSDQLSSYPFASGSNVVASPTTLSAARAYGCHTPIQGGDDYAYVINHGLDGVYSNEILRVATALNAAEADVGDLTETILYTAGGSSGTYGYRAGGYYWPPTSIKNTIDKWPFAATANATDVGDLTVARYDVTGNSSTTHGYGHAGMTTPGRVNTIDKYAFASDGNATDVGDVQQVIAGAGSSNGPTDAFVHGGLGDGSAYRQNRIQKTSFSSDGNSTDLGDLVARSGDRPGSTESDI